MGPARGAPWPAPGALLLVAWLAPIMSAQALPGLSAARVDVQPNLVLVAYAAAVMLLTALVCGITPALRSTRGQITSDLQHGGSRTSTGHLTLRHTFVAAQVAISLFLLVVASLFLRSLLRISSIDPGFDLAHGVVVRVPAATVAPGQQVMMSEQIAGRLRSIAGVRSVSWSMLVPFGNDLRAERSPSGQTAAIVGIAKDHAYRNRGSTPEPVLYRAYAQIPNTSTQPRPLIIHVRTYQPAESSLRPIREAMAEIDPNGPAFVEPLRDSTSQEILIRRAIGVTLSSVEILGLLLATIGLYGVMAYVVTSRLASILCARCVNSSARLA